MQHDFSDKNGIHFTLQRVAGRWPGLQVSPLVWGQVLVLRPVLLVLELVLGSTLGLRRKQFFFLYDSQLKEDLDHRWRADP